jgi:ABC-type amino acid transport substrate-binding protein
MLARSASETRNVVISARTPATIRASRLGAKWSAVCLSVLIVVTGRTAAAQTPPCVLHSPLVYVGDSDFPPYEYLDENRQPAGFNVQLVRALATALNRPIAIRLMTGPEAHASGP